MKVNNKWNYDDAYDKNIADWEDFLRSSRLSYKRTNWSLNLFIPFLLIGLGFAGWSWYRWFGILGSYWVFVMIFSLLEELNENIRYTRHKIVKGFESS